jgi:hypothetical protein
MRAGTICGKLAQKMPPDRRKDGKNHAKENKLKKNVTVLKKTRFR